MSEPHHCCLWVDLETSDLVPHDGRILEWAAVLAADDRGGDMRVIEQFTGVISLADNTDDPLSLEREYFPGVDPFVVTMHKKNGLWAECEAGANTLDEADQFLADLCESMGGEPGRDGGPGSVVLAGASIGQLDRPFIMHHMPKLARFVSYRCFDVSTLKMANQFWAEAEFKKARAHRALPDVLESLAHAAEIRALRWAP